MFDMFLWYVRHVPLVCSTCSFDMFSMFLQYVQHAHNTCSSCKNYMYLHVLPHVPCSMCMFFSGGPHATRPDYCLVVAVVLHGVARLPASNCHKVPWPGNEATIPKGPRGCSTRQCNILMATGPRVYLSILFRIPLKLDGPWNLIFSPPSLLYLPNSRTKHVYRSGWELFTKPRWYTNPGSLDSLQFSV